MNNDKPMIITDTNLSHAWARAFLAIFNRSPKNVSPLVLTLSGFDDGQPQEDSQIRKALEESLEACGKASIETVANTIFPASMWRYAKQNRKQLFQTYIDNLPRIKAVDKKKNRCGLYFERLVAFGSGPCEGNQLEFIISNFRIGIRNSILQASIFDPARDHSRQPRLGFPCLQHISFIKEGDGLALNAFYATQQIFEKAYGNYLGLCRLGNFMAHELGLRFTRLSCFAGIEKLDSIERPSTQLASLVEVLEQVTPTAEEKELALRA